MAKPRSWQRVFIVDDEFVIASTLKLILASSGFEAVSFTDPMMALEAARFRAPGLLLADVVMPQLSGIDLAIAVRALNPDCKVLLFSGQPNTSELLEICKANGHIFEVLAKPMHPSELLRRLQILTDQSPRAVPTAHSPKLAGTGEVADASPDEIN